MSFKGEIALGALNTKYKYGFTVGDVYRVQGAGNLVPNNLAVANGAFVEWKGTAWEVKKDMQYATSKTGESLDQAVADVLDDHDTATADEELTMPAASAANYTVGNYFEQDGEIWKCTDKTDNGDGTWTVEAEKVNGVVPILNAMQWKDVTIAPLTAPYTIPVHNHENVFVSAITGINMDVTIQCDTSCDEATVLIQASPTIMRSLAIKRGNSNMKVCGQKTLVGIDVQYSYDSFLIASYDEAPTDFSDIQIANDRPVINVTQETGFDTVENYLAVEIKKNYAVIHYV